MSKPKIGIKWKYKNNYFRVDANAIVMYLNGWIDNWIDIYYFQKLPSQKECEKIIDKYLIYLKSPAKGWDLGKKLIEIKRGQNEM